jgi:hypothetical protein
MTVRELFATLGVDMDKTSVKAADDALEGLKNGLTAVAVGFAAVGAALAGIVITTAKAAGHMSDLSQRTGVNAQKLQGLAYAAEQSDVSIDELAHGLNLLAKNSKVKDVNAEFLRLADQFEKLPDDGAKSTFAIAHFGRAGAALIPVLNLGSKKLRELSEEAVTLGYVMDEQLIKDGDQLDDLFTSLKNAAIGLRNELARELIPAVRDLVKAFFDWYKANAVVIRQRVKEFAAVVASGLRKVGDAVRYVIANWETIRKVLVPIMIAVGVVVAALAIQFAILAAAAVVAATATAVEWLLATAPLLLMVAIIGLLILAIQDLWVFFHGGDSVTGVLVKHFKEWFTEAIDSVKAKFWELVTSIKQWFIDTWDYVVPLVKKRFEQIIEDFLKSVRLAASLAGIALNFVPGVGLAATVLSGNASPFSGGAASPAAAAQLAGPKGGGTVVLPNVKIEQHIDAGPNASPADVASEVHKSTGEAITTSIEEAAAALGL